MSSLRDLTRTFLWPLTFEGQTGSSRFWDQVGLDPQSLVLADFEAAVDNALNAADALPEDPSSVFQGAFAALGVLTPVVVYFEGVDPDATPRVILVLVDRYLEGSLAPVHKLLVSLGVILPGPPIRLDPAALIRVMRDPEGWAQARLGWNDAAEPLRFGEVLSRELSDLAYTLDLAAPYRIALDSNEVHPGLGTSGDVPTTSVPLIQDDFDHSLLGDPEFLFPYSVEAGIRVLTVPEGAVLTPYARTTLSLSETIGDWRVDLEASPGQATGPHLVLKPGAIEILGGGVQAPKFSAALTYDALAAAERLVIPDVLRLRTGGPSLRVEVSEARGFVFQLLIEEVSVEAELGRDGLLSSILPGSQSLDLGALGLEWSDRGISFVGGDSLGVNIPVNLDLGPVNLSALAFRLGEAETVAELGVTVAAAIGPVATTVEGVGVRLVAGDENELPSPAFLPPRGAGLYLEVGPIEGGGFVSYSPDTGRYVGAMELQIGTLGLTAFGIIDTQMPDGSDGFSMLVLVTGRFTPIPIGFGFTLNALGGLLGIHRDIDVDALFAAIRAGTARDLLAPEDPVRDAPRLARQAGAIFPIARGQHVFGPTLQLGWGSPKQVITLDLGLAVTLPDPLRLILIGTIRAVLPDEKLAIAEINIDIAGVLDLSASRFDLEGRIYDSAIQGLPITGGFAMRSSWGRDRAFAFSIGGLHPGFSPPARFPTLDRMGVDLSRGSKFQFRLGGYFAITSNSLQLGARADLKVRQSGFTLLADLGFDALLIFDPFGMDLRIYAGATLKRGRTTLCSLRIEARLRGPGPWRVSGSVSVRILLLKVSVGFSKSFGQDRSALTEAVDAAALIAGALATPRSWIVEGASHAGDIVLDGLGEALGPYSPLAVQQKVAPLELRLDQLGGRRLTGPRRFAIRRLELGERALAPVNALIGAFAPAQFTEMTESERLSAPSFEDMIAGSTFAGDEVFEAEGPVIADTSIQMIILDAPPDVLLPAFRTRREMIVSPRPTDVSGMHRPVTPAARISVRTEAWVATDGALGDGQRGTHARLRQDAPDAVLARAGEVAA